MDVSPAISSNGNRYFNNTFHELKVLKEVITIVINYCVAYIFKFAFLG